MVVSFAFLYVMMAFLICPMIEDVLNERIQKIQQDLDSAEHLNRQAEVLHQRYQAFYLSAEKEKSQHIVSDRYTVHFWRDTDRGAVDRRTVQIFYQICHGENGNLRLQHG
jgi:hypothetical protein